ncbi:MAG TPA: glycosyltransferase family 9 protein [Sedimentisphaerales bacterium]|nr:glycosyltransferase family 9 protein [Sedimentisphaerales bacterium]
MNVELQRKIDRIAGTFICRVLSLFNFGRGKNTPVGEVRKVLVILLSEMGSLVLAYPMFRRIRKKYPNASLHVLLFKNNREMLETLKVIPPQHIFTMDNTSMVRFVKDGVSLLIKLRQAHFDVVVDCELFSRLSSILSFLSGAAVRVGFHPHAQEGLYRGDFISRPVLYNPYHHISQQFITLVEAIDSTTVPKAKRLVSRDQLEVPFVTFSQDEIQETARKLHTHAPSAMGKELVLIYPSGGLLPIRAWPLECYCYLSRQLLREGYAVGVIGLEGDKGLAEKIQSYCDDPCCIDLTGYTKSMQELMLLFHCAALLVTNDGGPGQFSAMTPIPTIVFFGPETPALYASLDRKTVIFHSPLSCSPCFSAYNHRKSPCDGDNICLKRIQPDQVLAKALEILRTSEHVRPTDLPPSTEIRSVPPKNYIAVVNKELT